MAVAEVLDPTDERRATLQTAQGAQIVIRKKTQASRISRYECGTTGLGANQLSLRCMELRMASSFASESYVASFTVFVGPFAFTDAIPLSIAEADEYISLFPIV